MTTLDVQIESPETLRARVAELEAAVVEARRAMSLVQDAAVVPVMPDALRSTVYRAWSRLWDVCPYKARSTDARD